MLLVCVSCFMCEWSGYAAAVMPQVTQAHEKFLMSRLKCTNNSCSDACVQSTLWLQFWLCDWSSLVSSMVVVTAARAAERRKCDLAIELLN